jgi:hypothetical protein
MKTSYFLVGQVVATSRRGGVKRLLKQCTVWLSILHVHMCALNRAKQAYQEIFEYVSKEIVKADRTLHVLRENFHVLVHSCK